MEVLAAARLLPGRRRLGQFERKMSRIPAPSESMGRVNSGRIVRQIFHRMMSGKKMILKRVVIMVEGMSWSEELDGGVGSGPVIAGPPPPRSDDADG